MHQFASFEPESKTLPYQVSNFIRHCTVDDRVVVLDLRVGQYLSFDEVASYMWNTLLSVPDHILRIDYITNHFDITRSQCEHDLNSFIENCKERELLVIGKDQTPINPPVSVRYNSPNTLNAWKCLYLTRRFLARSGFSVTYDLHSRMAKAETSANEDTAMSLVTAVQAFNRAENFFSTRDAGIDCLPRSLALHRFMLSVGVNANHCVGVRCYPFGAHAWVEVEGVIIYDSESFVSQFKEISRV